MQVFYIKGQKINAIILKEKDFFPQFLTKPLLKIDNFIGCSVFSHFFFFVFEKTAIVVKVKKNIVTE